MIKNNYSAMKFLISFLKIFLLSVLFSGIITINKNAQAHLGRTDSSRCYTCRTNCPSWDYNNITTK